MDKIKEVSRRVAKLRHRILKAKLFALFDAKQKLFGMPEAQEVIQAEINKLSRDIVQWQRFWI